MEAIEAPIKTCEKLYPEVGKVIGKLYTEFYTDKLAQVLRNVPELQQKKILRSVVFNHQLSDHLYSIADIGCGEGQSTQVLGETFLGAKVIGIDIDEKAIAHAKKHRTASNISFVCKFCLVPFLVDMIQFRSEYL